MSRRWLLFLVCSGGALSLSGPQVRQGAEKLHRLSNHELLRSSSKTQRIATPRIGNQLPKTLFQYPQLATDKEGQSHTDFRLEDAHTRNYCFARQTEGRRIAAAATDFFAFVPSLTESASVAPVPGTSCCT